LVQRPGNEKNGYSDGEGPSLKLLFSLNWKFHGDMPWGWFCKTMSSSIFIVNSRIYQYLKKDTKVRSSEVSSTLFLGSALFYSYMIVNQDQQKISKAGMQDI
jgi:hypothetical protein